MLACAPPRWLPLRIAAVTCVTAVLLATGCTDERDRAEPEAADSTLAVDTVTAPVEAVDLVQLLQSDPRFSTLVAALDSAGLTSSLQEPGPFTVFAPTNEAFAALPAGTLDRLLAPAQRDRLIDVLLFHIVQGTYTTGSLRDTTLMAQQAGMLEVQPGNPMRINDAPVAEADLAASNGVVHVLDAVLIPAPFDE